MPKSQPPAAPEGPAGRLGRLRKMLRSADTRYLGLLEGVPIGICWVSGEGRVLQCNRAMMAFTGYSEPEVSRMHMRQFFPSAEEYERLHRMGHERGTDWHYDGKLLRKDGTCRDARMTASCVTLDGSEVVLFSAIDITPRRQLEARLQEVEQILGEKELALEKKAIALSEVVEQVEIGEARLKEEITSNLREIVFPILGKLRLSQAQPEYVDLLENHLRTISSTNGARIAKVTPTLSPREAEISGMIQCGLASRQIARLLSISCETVQKHRRNIRKKVGISGTRTKLTSFLKGDS